MTDPIPAVQLVGVSKSFTEGQRTHRVLSGIDLEIAAGETVALVGASGSGKSTLLDLVGGLEQADAGTVKVHGTDLGGLTERERTLLRRRSIGLVFQAFHLIPTLSVLENILLGPDLDGRPGKQVVQRARELLADLGLLEREASFPDRLSGGERQRVALARALVHRPPLILADEPTGNLDGESAERVLDALFGLVEEQSGALLLVTHSERVAQRCSRLVRMEVLKDAARSSGE